MISGADGITYQNTNGIMASGADGLLSFSPNGIMASGADGIMISGADSLPITQADGVTYTGTNGIMASGADGIMISGADGIMASGADGIMISGADGTRYTVESVIIRQPSGIMASGADAVNVIGADGIMASGADGIMASGADGIMISGADGITISAADTITAIGQDGQLLSIVPGGITISGADIITVETPGKITISGADSITRTGADSVAANADEAERAVGLQSVDPELAVRLDQLTDDSNVNAIVVFHHKPTQSDIVDLQRLGVLAGTVYEALPMIALTATKYQIFKISHLPAVRSIYGNRTLQMNMDQRLAINGVDRARGDADLVRHSGGQAVSGRGVTVAVLDTGVDGTHADLAGRVAQNVKLADTQGLTIGFRAPTLAENVPNSDQAYGHGTFVAGVIAGSGSRSGGKYTGVAPGARLVGLSAGDLTLSFVLAGFDYILSRGNNLNVRVVNCSFSANTVFDVNDPVNIATKKLTDAGVNVVFSAGNTGDGLHTLNPYAVAPWVVSVGATDEEGRLAQWSSRGDMANSVFRPTLVAPGVNIIGLRSSGGASVTGVVGLANADSKLLAATELPFYTTANGTSFSAPQVAGVIALMLEANPNLKPAKIKEILQRTATPLLPYYQHEVGAGMLNAHAAVLESAFPQRRMGSWRATLDRGQLSFVKDEPREFTGTVSPGTSYETDVQVPDNAVLASVQVAWGPMTSVNDLALAVIDPNGLKREGNTINQPGLTGKRERIIAGMPAAGSWHVKVSNMLGVGTLQPITGALEVTRIEFAPLTDLNSLSTDARADIYQAMSLFVAFPLGSRYRPEFGISRADLAAVMVMGARLPQYMPAVSNYTDVRDRTTMNFVESVQAAPGGPLFPDVERGGAFRPLALADRLTAAVVLVRAAGLQSEVNARNNSFQQNSLPEFLDISSIPEDKRAYVAVALEHGLLRANSSEFRPNSPLTRAELAHAMVIVTNLVAQ
jgi:serine protease AprX